ncbi:hypothetical protein F373_gp234 [Bacillus phage SP-10]|uniref:hypothetical protein n=1 Tax=Bacillus phage SP10 TaxID=941058 RepID=UPI0002198BBE|nr:hypothetical protein F373_gp234 [Bacillus phage SP-10]BAK53046.1 hypothetical protein [Bacillus phage SP-10]
MYLDREWLKENFIEGTPENTKVGDQVYVHGIDGVDEVLYKHTVQEVLENSIRSIENNYMTLPYVDHPVSRGVEAHRFWYFKRETKEE